MIDAVGVVGTTLSQWSPETDTRDVPRTKSRLPSRGKCKTGSTIENARVEMVHRREHRGETS
jgi:hypothetical protein